MKRSEGGGSLGASLLVAPVKVEVLSEAVVVVVSVAVLDPSVKELLEAEGQTSVNYQAHGKDESVLVEVVLVAAETDVGGVGGVSLRERD